MVASRLYLGGQRAAKAIEEGCNDAGITHLFDCRGENLRGTHVELSLESFQVLGVKYARVDANRIMNQQLNGLLKFPDEVGRQLTGIFAAFAQSCARVLIFCKEGRNRAPNVALWGPSYRTIKSH